MESGSESELVEEEVLELSETVDAKYDGSLDKLKEDHASRPLWVCENGMIYLEAFSPVYKQASDFLIAIAEPVSRPSYIHEYKITRYSLYAGASMGLRSQDIVNGLNRLAKNEVISEKMIKLIEDTTARANKIKLLLKNQRYFVESTTSEVLLELLENADIFAARLDFPYQSHDLSPYPMPSGWERDLRTNLIVNIVTANDMMDVELPPMNNASSTWSLSAHAAQMLAMGFSEDEAKKLAEEEHIRQSTLRIYCFEIIPAKVESVRSACADLRYPMLEEYEFRKENEPGDKRDLSIQLKASVQIREYQEKSLAKMFGNGRARSGIIVLPCGAGKTLTAIAAAVTIKKSTLVFCSTEVAANQWRRQFKHFCQIADQDICMFTSNDKQKIEKRDPVILITTYSMIGFSGHRGKHSSEIFNDIRTREWGLVLLDEVHVAPANTFRRCVTVTHSRCKLGLTATLVREDDLVEDLFYLIGPKLYEANWTELQKSGYLAKVQCLEVRCEMKSEFLELYLKEPSLKKRTLLSVMNPQKFRACDSLMRQHVERGDKVLIYCDDILALLEYSSRLKVPYIYGQTGNEERLSLLHRFQHNPDFNVLMITTVGDNSIDLPDVNVIIQVSSFFASRRQEAQRLGRILRPKPRVGLEYNAFFYSLISTDTKEMYYATKRQRFLVDQGYAFQVLDSKNVISSGSFPLVLESKADQYEVLSKIISYDDFKEAEKEKLKISNKKSTKTTKRKEVPVASLSGADGSVYADVSKKSKPTLIQKQVEKNKALEKEATKLMNTIKKGGVV